MKNTYIIDNDKYLLGPDKNGQIHYIKEVQEVVLPIILEIDRICRKNDIPYALAFGSALGLYNYQGFIPWDDDADIVFNYEDLDRLIDAFKKDLKPEYVFDAYEVDERYNILQPTIKVKNKYGPTHRSSTFVPSRTTTKHPQKRAFSSSFASTNDLNTSARRMSR